MRRFLYATALVALLPGCSGKHNGPQPITAETLPRRPVRDDSLIGYCSNLTAISARQAVAGYAEQPAQWIRARGRPLTKRVLETKPSNVKSQVVMIVSGEGTGEEPKVIVEGHLLEVHRIDLTRMHFGGAPDQYVLVVVDSEVCRVPAGR